MYVGLPYLCSLGSCPATQHGPLLFQLTDHTLSPSDPVHANALFPALQWVAAGGLIAFLKDLPDIAVFDTRDAANPRYSHNITGVRSHVTDEFLPIPTRYGGGFVVTQMGSVTGGSPGRVALIDRRMQLKGEYPRNAGSRYAKLERANPHGVDVDFKSGKMLTTDFLEVTSAVTGPPA